MITSSKNEVLKNVSKSLTERLSIDGLTVKLFWNGLEHKCCYSYNEKDEVMPDIVFDKWGVKFSDSLIKKFPKDPISGLRNKLKHLITKKPGTMNNGN
jgi:hypothetical protein